MSDLLSELYQEVILDHYRKPRNHGSVEDSTGEAQGYNPLCGDTVRVMVREVDGRVVDIAFTGSGCAISSASASLMTEAVKGKAREEVDALIEDFHEFMVHGDGDLPDSLQALAGVRDHVARIKCATLPWHALKSALEGKETA